MSKSILCERIIDALPPDCPLRGQCLSFRGSCDADPCPACHSPNCFCEPKLKDLGLTSAKAKKPPKRKKGK